MAQDPTAIFDEMFEAFNAAITPEGRVIGEKFGVAALKFAPIYERIFGAGVVANHLKDDISKHGTSLISAIQVDPDRYRYVDEMVPRMVEEKGIDKIRNVWGDGVVELLWCKRALDYILRFVEYGLFTKTGESLAVCARQAYDEVLRPYHGVLVAGIVTLAFNLAPARDKFVKSLGFTTLENAQRKLKPLVDTGKPILAQVADVLAKNDCDFPDKV